ncbi:TetR/AcrR family transcriptional regulator [Paenarthrobacter sp. TYUT067]|uniref:TetR/AcrR family transcriptional regulator n=1 Tax=Paenarthrobacter sp. TYUT067 TaxID=2926245 RepID=UPI00202F605D|nr:TetR/AcrR family transcriptional regulator [Paenarthrobacter sp. TYUT067]MCM0616897.1 TetR/AcrR family transcriptional regulator [Paenarthrobacter sp. TYUT067]
MPLSSDVAVKRRVSKQALASEQRREQILDAAVEVFTAKGFNGASMREIAVRVGMSHTGMSHHFPDKAALLEAVLDRRVERANRHIDVGAGNGVSFLRGLVALTARDVASPSDLAMYCIVAAEALAPTHPAHGYFVRWYHLVRQAARTALEDLERTGRYRPKNVPLDIAATQIAGLRDGLNQQWLLAPDEVDLVDAVRAQLQFYVTDEL